MYLAHANVDFSGFEDFGISKYSHVDAYSVQSGRFLLTSSLSE